MTLTLTLTLDRVIRHTVVYDSLTSLYKANFVQIGKSFLWTDGRVLRTNIETGFIRLTWLSLAKMRVRGIAQNDYGCGFI